MPVRLAGLPGSVFQPLHDAAVPAVIAAAVRPAVTQNTSTPRPATTGTGELAQLPPMSRQVVQRAFWFGRRCRVAATLPSAAVR